MSPTEIGGDSLTVIADYEQPLVLPQLGQA
jgi:hypothetical protein